MGTIIMMACPELYHLIETNSTTLKYRGPEPVIGFMDKVFTKPATLNTPNSPDISFESLDLPKPKPKLKIILGEGDTPRPEPEIKPEQGGPFPSDPKTETENQTKMTIHDLAQDWVAQWCEIMGNCIPYEDTPKVSVDILTPIRQFHVHDELWGRLAAAPTPDPETNPIPEDGSNYYKNIKANSFRVVPSFLLSNNTLYGYEWHLLYVPETLPVEDPKPEESII